MCFIYKLRYTESTLGGAPETAKERENVADMKAYVQEVLEKIAVKDPQEKEFQDTAKEILTSITPDL